MKPGDPFSCIELPQELDRHEIGDRLLFGGKLLRQPAFVQLRQDRPEAHRMVGEMQGSDAIMTSTLFLRTCRALSEAMLEHEIKVIHFYAQSASAETLKQTRALG